MELVILNLDQAVAHTGIFQGVPWVHHCGQVTRRILKLASPSPNYLTKAKEDSDEDLRLSESDCEESGGSADVIDNIPVNPDVYISRDGTE
ncbi:hypothetical protein TNCV_1721992 [Trichonephila clavipes]|nr:hypothetical protein TNCV_1721992 [Trichonephila clavipes]